MKAQINLLLLILILFWSCEPPVVFDQAYPIGEADLDNIPNSFQGSFICESDSSIVHISDQLIIHESYYRFRSKLKDLEEREDCSIEDDKIFLKGMSECVPLKYINDSIVEGEYMMTDTLFKNKSHAFARLYRGHLFLSQKIKSNEWIVHFLTPDGNNLFYRAIADKSSIKEIEVITPIEKLEQADSDKPRYRITPTLKEFDLLIDSPSIFIECEYLIHINIEYIPNCKYPIRSNSKNKY